jgi:hypothetical protein
MEFSKSYRLFTNWFRNINWNSLNNDDSDAIFTKNNYLGDNNSSYSTFNCYGSRIYIE